jgi:hypothetical protein
VIDSIKITRKSIQKGDLSGGMWDV